MTKFMYRFKMVYLSLLYIEIFTLFLFLLGYTYMFSSDLFNSMFFFIFSKLI